MKTGQNATSNLASRLADSLFATEPKIDQLDQVPIPSCSSIVSIISLLRQILFPGFCDVDTAPWDSVNTYLEERLESLDKLLARQISIASALNQKFSGDTQLQDHDKRGQQLSTEFADKLPALRETLSTDVQAAYDGDPACRNLSEVILCYPGLQAVIVHRVAHELYLMKVPFLPRMMAEWVHGETGIDIHPGARIGKHFFIDHGTGVVIGQTCVIGEHVKIYQGVTLGALSFPTDGSGSLVRDTKRHPTIEDNVVIYANATVLGGQTIVGHDSVIGSSVWLTRSVEPFTTVIMEKPKLHLRNESPDDFRPPLDYQI